jgi:hypothetical protein
VNSALQAEAYGLLFAVKIAEALTLQEPRFLTDSKVLAATAVEANVSTTGPWAIRPIIAAIQETPSFSLHRISHVHRSKNYKAHHQAKLAVRIQNSTISSRCLSTDLGQCPVCNVLTAESVLPLKLLCVKCA